MASLNALFPAFLILKRTRADNGSTLLGTPISLLTDKNVTALKG